MGIRGLERISGGGSGDVTGSPSSTDNAIARHNGTTGKVIQNSDVLIDDNGNVVMPKTAGVGIKVNTASPSFGWRDILGYLNTRGSGPTTPAWDVFMGSTIRAYQFSINDEIEVIFHIPHDHVPGSDLFLHFHWAHNGSGVTGGTIDFSYELTYAKGHNQEPFVTPVTGTGSASVPTTQYQHNLVEFQISSATPNSSQINTSNIEPDGILLITVSLTANNMTGTPVDPFLFQADLHYQSTNIGTKNNTPDFNT